MPMKVCHQTKASMSLQVLPTWGARLCTRTTLTFCQNYHGLLWWVIPITFYFPSLPKIADCHWNCQPILSWTSAWPGPMSIRVLLNEKLTTVSCSPTDVSTISASFSLCLMQRQKIHVDSILCLAVRKGQATHTRLMTNYTPHLLLLHAAMLQKYWNTGFFLICLCSLMFLKV